MKIFFSIFENLSKKERIKLFWIASFILLLIFFELFSLSLFLPILKIFFTSEKITIFDQNFFFNNLSYQNQIYFLLAFLVLLYVAKNIFNSFLIFYKKKFLSDIKIKFSSRVFNYYLNQYDFFLDKQT